MKKEDLLFWIIVLISTVLIFAVFKLLNTDSTIQIIIAVLVILAEMLLLNLIDRKKQ